MSKLMTVLLMMISFLVGFGVTDFYPPHEEDAVVTYASVYRDMPPLNEISDLTKVTCPSTLVNGRTAPYVVAVLRGVTCIRVVP